MKRNVMPVSMVVGLILAGAVAQAHAEAWGGSDASPEYSVMDGGEWSGSGIATHELDIGSDAFSFAADGDLSD